MKVIALLPMKGNSERVPNKNMKLFGGKPLYHAIAGTLLKSDYIDLIVINTDSSVIAEDAKATYGNKVKIVERPADIRGDFVSMNEIIKYDLSQLDDVHFMQTHSTNPLLSVPTINSAVEYYFAELGKNCDSVFSVTRLQARLYDSESKPINHDPNELRRTQDLEPLFEENSNFYLFSKDSFAKSGCNRIGLKPKLFEVNKLEAVDIDEPEDFVLAELLYENMRK